MISILYSCSLKTCLLLQLMLTSENQPFLLYAFETSDVDLILLVSFHS